ncbi:immunoglobulin lambda-1 light chain-like [Carcharodon carcharias]|uniref:immunoglobulin lambda-1 light chain-like n=1 Tax=Carcharodon carcharias TaxID=13397 RepID=UPI001B7F5373|nr:immunoglobulin lambda-1 light chain-like [Carcharodon carcharias]
MAPVLHLLWALLLHLTGVLAVLVLNQSPISDPVSAGQTARLQCGMQNGNVGSSNAYWHRQRPGEAPVWVLKHSKDGSVSRGTGFTDRFQPSRDTSRNNFILTVGSLESGDSAVYYCLVYDSSAGLWIFGGGTTLNVRSTEDRSPSVLLLPPSSEEIDSDSATLSCLVSGFKPGFVRVLWSVDGKETDSGVRTSVVSPDSDQTYSLSSYLRVPATDWKKGSRYSCSVSHGSLNSPLLNTISFSDCSL